MDFIKINKYRKEIMGISALWIIYHHLGPSLFGNTGYGILKNIEWYVDNVGFCGVDIFLLLSGMGLVYSIQKHTLKEFYIRRFMRVYTSFWIWFTLSTIVRDDEMAFGDYLKRITFYTNWTNNILDYKWFVAAIVMFYLWFPLYYNILKKVKCPSVVTGGIIVLHYCIVNWFFQYIRYDLFLVVDRIPVFLIGILIGHLLICYPDAKIWKCQMSRREWSVLLVGTIALSMVKCNQMWQEHVELFYRADGLILVLSILYCVILAKFFDMISKLRWGIRMQKVLSFIGMLSLELYLTHELIGAKVVSYNLQLIHVKQLNDIIIFGIGFILSFITAWMVYQIAEVVFKGGYKKYWSLIKRRYFNA